jgi:Regulator of chromosome condensation (RCC1) repeat
MVLGVGVGVARCTAAAGADVVAWGDDESGEATVPSGLTGVIAISAGTDHTLALKQDGTVVAWGANSWGQATVPAGLTGVTAISAGWAHSLALKRDGTVVAWGDNEHGQTTVPVGLAGVTAIAAGYGHSLALKSDGTVVAWGWNRYGEATVPVGLAGGIAIAAGTEHSLALKRDGTVVAWGWNDYGQASVPVGLTGVVAISAGWAHSLALRGSAAGVTGAFTVSEPVVCIRLDTTGLDFGAVPLGGSRELADATTVTSCGDVATVYAQAGDARAGGASGAVWEPVVADAPPLCSAQVPPTDRFAYALASDGTRTYLTGDAAGLGALAAGGTRTDTHTLSAACAGSHGQGDAFHVGITYTATAR